MNIASLAKHHDELCVLLKMLNYKFKIIGISETRLKDNVTHTIDLDEYIFLDTKTLTHAGGTALYVHNSIADDIKLRTDLSVQIEGMAESTFIELKQSRKKKPNMWMYL